MECHALHNMNSIFSLFVRLSGTVGAAETLTAPLKAAASHSRSDAVGGTFRALVVPPVKATAAEAHAKTQSNTCPRPRRDFSFSIATMFTVSELP